MDDYDNELCPSSCCFSYDTMGSKFVIDLCSASSNDEDEDCNESSHDASSLNNKAAAVVTNKKMKLPRHERHQQQHHQRRGVSSDSSGLSLTETAATAGTTDAVASFTPILILQTDSNEKVLVTDGLMEQLVNLSSRKSKRSSNASNISVCRSSTLLHIQQQDAWSCGFRNLQMMLSALLPLLPVHRHPYWQDRPMDVGVDSPPGAVIEIPSLLQIQHGLEQAWSLGMDPKGREHYRGRIAGTKAQIGAVEVATCLNLFRLDATVVQFITIPESRNQLGPFCGAYFSSSSSSSCCCCCCCWNCQQQKQPKQEQHKKLQQEPVQHTSRQVAVTLLDRIEQQGQGQQPQPHFHHPGASSSYSSSSCSNGGCGSPNKLPLYLQYEGHSVTVVGVEYSHINNNNKKSRKRHHHHHDDDTEEDHVVVVNNLLVLDPYQKGLDLLEAVKTYSKQSSSDDDHPADHNNLRPLRRSCRELQSKNCQIVVCSPSFLSSSSSSSSAAQSLLSVVTAKADDVLRFTRRGGT